MSKKEKKQFIIEAVVILCIAIWFFACCGQISDHASILSDAYQQPYSWWNLIGHMVRSIG